MSDPVRPRGGEYLAELLPLVLRTRDAEEGGGALAALLDVIGEQVDVVADDLDRLYRDWFIETCEPWVVPYIGALVGYRPLHPAGSGAVARSEVEAPRRDVANTVANRRAKGTLAVLERLARDTAGWPSHAVEFDRLLARTQHLNHLRLDRGRTADLRDGDALERLGGPYDLVSRHVATPRINSPRTQRRHNVPSVGVFVWRLRGYRLSRRAPAFCIDRARSRYTFSALGNDTPLMIGLDRPEWISRRDLERHGEQLIGPQRSLAIAVGAPDAWIDREQIVSADLSGWTYRPRPGQVAVDPVRGRIAFPARHSPDTGVWVVYHYGFPADLGGGEYRRPLRPAGDRHVYRVLSGAEEAAPEYDSIMAAILAWENDRHADAGRRRAVIEIADSEAYVEAIEIHIEEGDQLELRAAQGARPYLRLLDRSVNRPDSLRVIGPEPGPEEPDGEDGAAQRPCEPACPHPGRLVLDGLLLGGRSVRITGAVGEVLFRHCTLVPGWDLEPDCEPESATEPSIEVDGPLLALVVDHSIVGSILVDRDEVRTEPLALRVDDSVLDATAPGLDAVSASQGRHAHATATVRRSTIVGRVALHSVSLGENGIFVGRLTVVRRQLGCLRYCSVTLPSRTPRRHRCQPDVVMAAAPAALRDEEERRVAPQFDSLRYGTPEYARLALTCAPEIRTGADDESQMGVYHDLFEPQREANLRARLDEYTPAGMDAGIIFVT